MQTGARWGSSESARGRLGCRWLDDDGRDLLDRNHIPDEASLVDALMYDHRLDRVGHVDPQRVDAGLAVVDDHHARHLPLGKRGGDRNAERLALRCLGQYEARLEVFLGTRVDHDGLGSRHRRIETELEARLLLRREASVRERDAQEQDAQGDENGESTVYLVHDDLPCFL